VCSCWCSRAAALRRSSVGLTSATLSPLTRWVRSGAAPRTAGRVRRLLLRDEVAGFMVAVRTMIRCASADDKGPFQTVQCVKPTSARRQLSIRGTSVNDAARA
jgi:hypothetical protein